MTLAELLTHWGLSENPFRGEEARADAVFARMSALDTGAMPGIGGHFAAFHSDFEKVLGDLARPSSSIVFGEKGSGKTAMRLQLASRIAAYNAANPGAKVLLVAYDDLNSYLDRLHARLAAAGSKGPLESFQKLRLVDHLDAILHIITVRLIDALLNEGRGEAVELNAKPREIVKNLDKAQRRALLRVQSVYDRPDRAPARTRVLRRRLRILPPWSRVLSSALAYFGWVPALVVFVLAYVQKVPLTDPTLLYALGALVSVWLLAILKHAVWDELILRTLGRRVRKQIRVLARAHWSFADSLAQLDRNTRASVNLPVSDSDEIRYVMLDALRGVLAKAGYAGIVVIVDRMDEPTLVSGDADRMRAVVWPMLNNKFLQREGVGIKMLLPIELRHALFKESNAFFQEARLDKQNLVERLQWTGASLYDLCEARLKACVSADHAASAPSALIEMFDQDVTRQDLIEALDQMHQPRDAFKMLYRCMTEHCATVTRTENMWRIPRATLEMVRRQEAERVQQLYRGIRPA